MWKPVKLNNQIIGHSHQTNHSLVFFGNANANQQEITEYFSDFNFCSLNQVHKDKLVCAEPMDQLTADAHYTDKKNQALFIRTADCMPVMIEHNGFIYSIHAGWRSLVAGIIDNVANHSAFNADTKVFIGPHIHKDSFETGEDVFPLFEQFIKKHLLQFEESFFYTNKNHKNFFDLNLLLQKQLIQLGVNQNNIFDMNINTFTNDNYHSYRRNNKNPLRQYSFISRIG